MNELSRLAIQLLTTLQWTLPDAKADPLASGEYHQNILITEGEKRYVFRINLDSQINRSDQIYYEYSVLQQIQDSGRTPLPLGVIWPGDKKKFSVQWANSPPKVLAETPFPRGALLSSFLPGVHLDYSQHARLAADTLALIHRLPLSPTSHIIVQEHPVHSLCEESTLLLKEELPEYKDIRKHLLKLRDKLSVQTVEGRKCIVNTELNNENFLVHNNIAYLVDWEKAVITHPAVDIAHFLLPTTTGWKTSYVFSSEERKLFLKRYCRTMSNMKEEELESALSILEPAVLLRALSWCYSAWFLHVSGKRPIVHKSSLQRIKKYLGEASLIIRRVCS